MGGFGSGNWRRDRKYHVEECPRIDIRRWHREGFLKPGRCFTWACASGGAQGYSINVAVWLGRITLRSGNQHAYTDREVDEQPISIEWTKCNYGGSRPWFICPSPRCGRRVAILYAGSRGFACRHCHQLGYASQHENAAMRAVRRAKKIRIALGAGLSLLDPLPDKPERMHWRTYFGMLLASQEAHIEARRALVSIADGWRCKLDYLQCFAGKEADTANNTKPSSRGGARNI